MKIALYIDGKLEETASSLEKRIKEPCNPYFIGGMPTTTISDVPSESNSYIFPGAIDHIVFSNRTYSANEVLNLAGGPSAK